MSSKFCHIIFCNAFTVTYTQLWTKYIEAVVGFIWYSNLFFKLYVFFSYNIICTHKHFAFLKLILFYFTLILNVYTSGPLGGSVGWVSGSWFQLLSRSHGSGDEALHEALPQWRLCLTVLSLCPSSCSLSLSPSQKNKIKWFFKYVYLTYSYKKKGKCFNFSRIWGLFRY